MCVFREMVQQPETSEILRIRRLFDADQVQHRQNQAKDHGEHAGYSTSSDACACVHSHRAGEGTYQYNAQDAVEDSQNNENNGQLLAQIQVIRLLDSQDTGNQLQGGGRNGNNRGDNSQCSQESVAAEISERGDQTHGAEDNEQDADDFEQGVFLHKFFLLNIRAQ